MCISLLFCRDAVFFDKSEFMSALNKVLIVDDDEYVCAILSWAVKKAGAKPVVFNSSKRALRSFYENDDRYSLAILDLLFINDLDGISLGERMIARRPDMHIILCTGYPVADVDELRSRVAAFGDYIDKPVNMRNVTECICKAIGLIIK